MGLLAAKIGLVVGFKGDTHKMRIERSNRNGSTDANRRRFKGDTHKMRIESHTYQEVTEVSKGFKGDTHKMRIESRQCTF